MTESGRTTDVDSAVRTTAGSRTVIAGLTGVRAVMGLWVVADHLIVPMTQLLPGAAVLTPMLSGGIALDTFFILSGFVISHVYAGRLATLDRRSYGAFLWARLTRLYPTHLLALGAMAGVIAYVASRGNTVNAAYHYTAWTFLGNVALLQAVPGVDAWNGPSWSVCSEFAAYLLMPFFAGVLVRLGRRRALVLAGAVLAGMVVALGLLGPAAVLVSAFWVRPLGEVALGCLLWSLWRHDTRRHWRWDVVAAAALGAVVLFAALGSGPVRFLAVPLLGVFVVAVARASGPVLRVLTSRPLEWAGRTSYSRYLLHQPVLMVLWLCFPVALYTAAPLAVRIAIVASWFVGTFAVGGLVFRTVEEPARRGLRRRGDRWGIGSGTRPDPAPAPPEVGPDVAGTPPRDVTSRARPRSTASPSAR